MPAPRLHWTRGRTDQGAGLTRALEWIGLDDAGETNARRAPRGRTGSPASAARWWAGPRCRCRRCGPWRRRWRVDDRPPLPRAAASRESPKPMKLHVLPAGRLRMRESIFRPEAPREALIDLPVGAFLIRHPQGNLLFDTGCHPSVVT